MNQHISNDSNDDTFIDNPHVLNTRQPTIHNNINVQSQVIDADFDVYDNPHIINTRMATIDGYIRPQPLEMVPSRSMDLDKYDIKLDDAALDFTLFLSLS